jgi:hypothetical protein
VGNKDPEIKSEENAGKADFSARLRFEQGI